MRFARITLVSIFALVFTSLACVGTTVTPAPVEPPILTPEPPTATVSPINLPLAESPQLVQFHFINENDGWGTTETKVVRTNDGGVTWYDATPPTLAEANYAPFAFLDPQTAWVLISSADFTLGTLYRTDDGGLDWGTYSVPFGMASLQFLDSQNGFALAALGAGAGSEAVALFKTTDGGLTWTRVFINDPTVEGSSDSLPLGGQKTGFTFLDGSRGWVGGSVPVDGYIYLYATQDGGVTWNETNLALPAGYESAQTSNDAPQFFSATDGILAVTLVSPSEAGPLAVIYRTTDGGLTWTPGQPIARDLPADFHSFNEGVIWGISEFLVTRDAGQTWGAVVPNENFSDVITSFQFASSLVGWALVSRDSADTSLYKTTNGGATWTLLIP